MTGNLLIVVPTRGRPGNIARLLDSVHATSKLKTHIHIGVDDDDPELENYHRVMDKAANPGDEMSIGPRKGLTGWTNEIAVPAAEVYPFLASFGDDMVPRTPGWDKALIEGIERMGATGFTYPWDGTREDIPEACVMSSNIVMELGWMAHPDLNHWYIDNVWADLGRGAGCIKHLRAIAVDHVWKADATSKDSAGKLAEDRDAYYGWRKERMADDVKIITALREKTLEPA